MEHSNCPFCQPDIALLAFLESPHFLVICNHAPILPGHSLIIPKEHKESFHDLSDEALTEMMQLARRALARLKIVFGTDAFNLTIQEKEESGQSIMHLHMHLIPRNKNDFHEPGDWYPVLRATYHGAIDRVDREKLTPLQLQLMAARLRKE